MIITEKLQALSLKQPYASLMLPPFFKIETRSWNTEYRGLVLICSSKQPYSLSNVEDISGPVQTDRILKALPEYHSNTPLGQAIAIGRLVHTRPMMKKDEYDCYVKFESWLWCHIYEDVRAIKPMPWIGSQGMREVGSHIKEKIQFI